MVHSRVFIDINVIQSVPPSCLNRDDTGSPKTCMYGGVRRARVSSQSWKKAVRDEFQRRVDPSELGFRTKKIVDLIAARITEIDSSKVDDAVKMATDILKNTKISVKVNEKKKKVAQDEGNQGNPETGALFFISTKQIDNLANLAISGETDKKVINNAINTDHSIDIALFGRMVADDPSLNTDASVQVAHSISTHRVDNEYDYFTAVDDKAPEDNAGAGMIGTVEYNSSTLYRYATIAVHDLKDLLGDEGVSAVAVSEFIRAFILSMPTGKQNTFANRTVPYSTYITIRNDQPLNLSPAFEMPVQMDVSGGYNAPSTVKMIGYAKKAYSEFVDSPVASWQIGESLDSLGEVSSLGDALQEIQAYIREN